MFYQRHSDWSTKTPLRMQIWTAKIHSAEPYPALWKTSVPGLLHYVQFDENAIPNQWRSVQATKYILAWNLTRVKYPKTPTRTSVPLQNKSVPRNPRNADGTIHWNDVRFSQVMVSAGSQKLQRHDLINGSFQKRWQLLPQSEGHLLVNAINMWMTRWCKDFEELEGFAD